MAAADSGDLIAIGQSILKGENGKAIWDAMKMLGKVSGDITNASTQDKITIAEIASGKESVDKTRERIKAQTIGNPAEYILHGVEKAATGALRTNAKQLRNNGNALADMLLAQADSVSSGAQNNAYGRTKFETALRQAATEEMRKKQNYANWFDYGADTIDATYDKYDKDNEEYKMRVNQATDPVTGSFMQPWVQEQKLARGK